MVGKEKPKNDLEKCLECDHYDDPSEYLVLVSCDFCRDNKWFVLKKGSKTSLKNTYWK